MIWETFQRLYRNHMLANSQVEILTLVGTSSVKDFPRNIPADLRDPLLIGMRRVGETLTEAVDDLEQGTSIERKINVPKSDPTKGKLLQSVLILFASQIDLVTESGLDEKFQIGFERLLTAQQVVMLFAYLDAFMGDTVRAICSVCPDVLKSSKKLEWSTALAFEKKEELVTHLTERYVYDFGWLNITDRLAWLSKEIGLELETPKADLELIKWAENIRHISVHNGGRVSAEFVERTKRSDMVVGEFVPLTIEELDRIRGSVTMLASDLFVAVSTKFFGIEEAQLTGVLGRTPIREAAKVRASPTATRKLDHKPLQQKKKAERKGSSTKRRDNN